MPPKPRPHGRKPPPRPGSGLRGRDLDRKTLAIAAIGGIVAIAAVALVAVLALGGDDSSDPRSALEAAGCTLSATPAVRGDHSVSAPDGTSPKWKTDPPTSGPHYEITVVWGVYGEPVNQAQLVHNLEHGGIEVQYGDKVPESTVQQLTTFAHGKPRGTVLAPYPKLGDKIALGAWVTPSAQEYTKGTAYLAKCSSFDEKAFDAFFDAYQFKGPERFPADSLLPGRN